MHPIDESFAFDLLPGGGQGDDFVGVPCKPVNGEPSPARLLMARATMAAVPIGAVLAALAGLVFLARSVRQAFRLKVKSKRL